MHSKTSYTVHEGQTMNRIYQLLAYFLPTKSVDAIVGQLSAIAKALAAAEARENDKADAIRRDIAVKQAEQATARAEAARAKRAAEKISDLFA